MRRITQLDAKLNYNQIIIDASNRFHAIVNACMNSKDYLTIARLTCSSMYSSKKDIPVEDGEEEEKTDVPWFLTMLKENHVPAEYCVGLFSCWCSCEGAAAIAEKCMDIQTKYGIDMTTVWKRLSVNEPLQNTDWTEEVDRYKEAIK